MTTTPDRHEPEPDSEADYKQRYDRMMAGRRNASPSGKIGAIIVLFLFLVAITVAMLFSKMKSADKQEPQAYTAVPLDITHVEHMVVDTKTSRGFRVSTPDWIIVTDVRSTYEPATHGTELSALEKMASRNLSAICEIAKERNESVTFIGHPAETKGVPRNFEGKPVLIAQKLLYGGQEILLVPK